MQTAGQSRAFTLSMDRNLLALWLTVGGTACWGVCFWWMHRISTSQNKMLEELRGQARRIEKLSKAEHDLIKEVHPQVGEIKEGMSQMIAAAAETQKTRKKTPARKIEPPFK